MDMNVQLAQAVPPSLLGDPKAAHDGNPDHLEGAYDLLNRRDKLTKEVRRHMINTVASNSPKAPPAAPTPARSDG